MKLRYLEGIAAAAFGAAAAFYLYVAWQLPVPRYTVASTPGFLPIVLATLMLCLCAALLGKALLARGGDAPVEFSAVGLAKCAAGLMALFGYVLLLDTLGFLLSTFLFLVAVTPLFGRIPWWMWFG
ncbi:MAG TPA: tripartite tricarboxylate transporter TctB family protein, partial [Hyphomicrobiaceae bacterium]|nr:tripartite tricarboxylate transporter TctB family protein [Hyphomicrobiaceae bacterium]